MRNSCSNVYPPNAARSHLVILKRSNGHHISSKLTTPRYRSALTFENHTCTLYLHTQIGLPDKMSFVDLPNMTRPKNIRRPDLDRNQEATIDVNANRACY